MKPAIIAAAAVLVLTAAGDASAYCVYNKSDRAAHFSSFGGPNFSKTVQPGGKACCPYNERTCNSGTKRTTVTQMATSITTSSTNLGIGSVTKGFRCGELMGTGMNQFTQGQGHGYWVQGSGWAELHKSGDGYVVQVYNADSKHRGNISCPAY